MPHSCSPTLDIRSLFCKSNIYMQVNITPWCRIHSTTFLIGHFYFTVFSTKPISSKFSVFHTDVCKYRNPLKFASLLSRSVVQLYHYWFPHFRCDVIIWNKQLVKTWCVMFYKVYCYIKNILYYVNLSQKQALLKIKINKFNDYILAKNYFLIVAIFLLSFRIRTIKTFSLFIKINKQVC